MVRRYLTPLLWVVWWAFLAVQDHRASFFNGSDGGGPLLGDVPVVGDYDADGRADVAVYRELTAEWFIRTFDDSVAQWHWGAPSLGDAVRSF